MGAQQHNQDYSGSKLERSKFAYEQINNWIENADNKVSVSCGIFTGVFGVISFLSGRITPSETVNECWRIAHHWSFAISLVTMLISILFYVLAINPNLGSSGKKKNGVAPRKKYPVFYGEIAEMTEDEYRKTMNKATEEELISELQNETYFNSRICSSKMRHYRIGLWFSFAAVVIAGFSRMASYFMIR